MRDDHSREAQSKAGDHRAQNQAQSATGTMFTPEQHRAQAAYLKQFPGPKAQRAANLHELAARMIEKKNSTASKGDPAILEKKLENAVASRDKWNRVAANPQLSAPAALAARSLARSYAAAAKLYDGALAYQEKHQDKRDHHATAEMDPRDTGTKILGVQSKKSLFAHIDNMRQETLSKSNAGNIYILRPRMSIAGQEVIKIGRTTRAVAERVRELTTGSAVSFEIMYTLHVENARLFEKYLHTRYRDRRVRAGGGQEFFAVPARDVIAEVERKATEISRVRAQASRNGEMAAFLVQIGAADAERRISSRLGWPLFACCLSGTFGIHLIAHSNLGERGSAVWLTIFTFLFLSTISSIAYQWLKQRSMALYYEPRFRSSIEAKHKELQVKYPLAYLENPR